MPVLGAQIQKLKPSTLASALFRCCSDNLHWLTTLYSYFQGSMEAH